MSVLLKQAEKEFLSEREFNFGSGDTVSVSYKIQEGNKSRIQTFQGVVIEKSGSGLSSSFTVRKTSTNGVYVERIFPLHSPLLAEIKVVRRGRVRRSKLYYIRTKTGKATRIEERR